VFNYTDPHLTQADGAVLVLANNSTEYNGFSSVVIHSLKLPNLLYKIPGENIY